MNAYPPSDLSQQNPQVPLTSDFPETIATNPATDTETETETETETKEAHLTKEITAEIAYNLLPDSLPEDEAHELKEQLIVIQQLETEKTTLEGNQKLAESHEKILAIMNNWLFSKTIKIGEMALLIASMAGGLSGLAAKSLQSTALMATVLYMNATLPEAYQLPLYKQMHMAGLATLSTITVGLLPKLGAGLIEDGLGSAAQWLHHLAEGTETYFLEPIGRTIQFLHPGLSHNIFDGAADFGFDIVQDWIGYASNALGAGGTVFLQWFANSTEAILRMFYTHLSIKLDEAETQLQNLTREYDLAVSTQGDIASAQKIHQLEGEVNTLHAMIDDLGRRITIPVAKPNEINSV